MDYILLLPFMCWMFSISFKFSSKLHFLILTIHSNVFWGRKTSAGFQCLGTFTYEDRLLNWTLFGSSSPLIKFWTSRGLLILEIRCLSLNNLADLCFLYYLFSIRFLPFEDYSLGIEQWAEINISLSRMTGQTCHLQEMHESFWEIVLQNFYTAWELSIKPVYCFEEGSSTIWCANDQINL